MAKIKRPPKIIKNVSKKVASSKRKVSSKSSPVKRNITKKNKLTKNTKNKLPKKIVVLFVIFILSFIATIILFIYPGMLRSNGAVLGNSNKYNVTEDQLAMFATLSYEDATHKKMNDTTNIPEPVTLDSDNNPVSFAVCNGVRGTLDLTDEVIASDDVKSCMTNPSSISANLTDNMFNKEDFVGNNLINLPDNASATDKIANGIAFIMANSIQIEQGEHYYFNGLINIDSVKRDFLKNWVVVDFYDQPTTGLKYFGKISAITFFNPTTKEVVISYRGTDLTDVADWVEDLIGYASFNNTGQDKFAENYAKYIADIYSSPDYDIYITGHSLGGYLAEVGAAKLIKVSEDGNSADAGNLKRVVYFNGMGLFAVKPIAGIRENPKHEEIANKFLLWNSSNGKVGDKVTLVHMYGDLVSSIGVHYGQVKTLHPSHDVAMAYNAEYSKGLNTKLATLITNTQGVLHDLVLDLISLNPKYEDMTIDQIIKSVPIPDKWKWLVTNDGSGVEALTKIVKFISDLNVNTSTWSSSWKENNSKAFLGWMMTVHPTDSFFYTKTYYDICTSGTDDEKVGCAYIADKYTVPTQDSIDSIVADTSTTTMYDDHQTTCSFTVDPATITKGESVTGKITCSDSDGLRDDIDTSKITEEFGYNKLSVASVKAIKDNDINRQSWNVVLNANVGAEHPVGKTWMWVDKGFVKDTYGQTNKNTRSNQIMTQNSRPYCTFTVKPAKVKKGSSTKGVITCTDKDGIDNSSMNKSKITEEFAHYKLSVGRVTAIADNDSTTQSWNVTLSANTGIFNFAGDTWMWADAGFVKDVSGGLSNSVKSNKITTVN